MQQLSSVMRVLGAITALSALVLVSVQMTALLSPSSSPSTELLQRPLPPLLHSASYYSQLASKDSWMAGPQLKQAAHKARFQQLTDWNSGALAGTASYVTMCAKGDDSACDKLMSDPGAVAALQNIDKKNPNGFASEHPNANRQLSKKIRYERPPKIFHRPQRQNIRFRHRVATPALRALKKYKTAGFDKNIWGTKAWKDGTLSDTINDQWLKACGEGNFYACQRMSQDNDALHDLLKPGSRPHVKKARKASLKPVYVTKKSPSFFGGLMNDLGLSDSYTPNGDQSSAVPRMVPDSGLDGRGRKAIYNDGTVADFLSDRQ
mmetsp:Transcript_13900/g.21669  ORF Transcript_13900/g.21669 Transcript_13900/m.21669 type:complete len:320 (+) Transcript_13900:52-1011(+)